MKFQLPASGSRRGTTARPVGGFTLPEILIAMTLFVLLVVGIVYAHLFGLRMFLITQTKLSATDDARQAMGRMVDEIRTSRSTWIGNVQFGVFEALLDGEVQQGSGLLIYPTTNSADYIIYFRNPTDQTFRRTTSSPGSATIVAETITNTVIFRAQDHLGQVLTNMQNNHVIHLNLTFYQPRRHQQAADYYQLETSVTRRTLE